MKRYMLAALVSKRKYYIQAGKLNIGLMSEALRVG